MPGHSSHVSGHASVNLSRPEHGQFSAYSWPSSFGVTNCAFHEDLMGTSLPHPAHDDPIANGTAYICSTDVSLNGFCDNNVAKSAAFWKDYGPSDNISPAQKHQQQILSGEEVQSTHFANPEDFDIHPAQTASRPRDSGATQQRPQIINRNYLSSQSSEPKIKLSTASFSGKLPKSKPASTLTRRNSAQSHEASKEPSATAPSTAFANSAENTSNIGELFASMDSSETLNSPHNSSANGKSVTSLPANVSPNDDIANSTRIAETITEGETSISDQNHATNRQVLLPGVVSSPTLPAGKVFPIQIGSDLFKLSGASISSDGKNNIILMFDPGSITKRIRAPSYFSQFFSEQLLDGDGRGGNIRTLYIDRDPDTFRDILLHLQGSHSTSAKIELDPLYLYFGLLTDIYRLPRQGSRRSSLCPTICRCSIL